MPKLISIKMKRIYFSESSESNFTLSNSSSNKDFPERIDVKINVLFRTNI